MASGRNVWIVDGLRTPFAKAGMDLASVKAVDLALPLVRELSLRHPELAKFLDEVVFGNTGNPEDAANITRVIALRAGLSQSISAYTVHRNCASALEAVSQGLIKISSGEADVMLVGGTESMSNIPLLYSKQMTAVFADLMRAKSVGAKMAALSKFRPSFLKPIIALEKGLTDPVCGLNMGLTAELIAREAGITRKDQDQFALESHQKAAQATKNGTLRQEIFPLQVGDRSIQDDMGPRDNQSLEALGKLKPYFDRKNGTVTVGNACPITDGAVALILVSEEKARALGYTKPLAKIRSVAFAGLEPERMGLGPAVSTPKALKKAGLTLKDIGLAEINEAFAAQVLAVLKAFESKAFSEKYLGTSQPLGSFDPAHLNVNGGAIALGHPVGATGARLILTLAHEMQRRSQVQFGLATLCIGGGQGGSAILEKVS